MVCYGYGRNLANVYGFIAFWMHRNFHGTSMQKLYSSSSYCINEIAPFVGYTHHIPYMVHYSECFDMQKWLDCWLYNCFISLSLNTTTFSKFFNKIAFASRVSTSYLHCIKKHLFRWYSVLMVVLPLLYLYKLLCVQCIKNVWNTSEMHEHLVLLVNRNI